MTTEVPKEPPTAVGVKKSKTRIIDVKRQHVELRKIADEYELSYDPFLSGLSKIAGDVDRDIEGGDRRAIRTGREVVLAWRKHMRYLDERAANPPRPAYYANHYVATAVQPTTRSRGQHSRTISLPRTRSREQSHAPRSTPKAAQRSGDSGDSSDPPGPEAAALAAFLLCFACLTVEMRGLA